MGQNQSAFYSLEQREEFGSSRDLTEGLLCILFHHVSGTIWKSTTSTCANNPGWRMLLKCANNDLLQLYCRLQLCYSTLDRDDGDDQPLCRFGAKNKNGDIVSAVYTSSAPSFEFIMAPVWPLKDFSHVWHILNPLKSSNPSSPLVTVYELIRRRAH